MRRPRRKKNGKWQIRYPDAHGRTRYKTFSTRKAAETELRKIHNALEQGLDPRCDVRFDQLVKEWRSEHLSHGLRPSTVKDYKAALGRLSDHFGKRLLRSITPNDVSEFRNELIETIRAERTARFEKRLARDESLADREEEIRANIAAGGIRTSNKVLATLRTMLKFAEARGYVPRNVAMHVKRLREQPRGGVDESMVLAPEEITRLFKAAPADHRCAFKLLIYTGLRIGELFGLQWGDLDWASGRLFVRRQLSGMTGELTVPKTQAAKRHVDVPTELISELKRWKLKCPKGSFDLMFPNTNGGLMDACNWRRRVWHPALRRAKLRRIRIHDCRHTFASLLIASGADVVMVSRRLGHANPAVTLGVYSHLFERRDSESLGDRLADYVRQQTTY